MEHPPVSIVIPNYNGERLLPLSHLSVWEAARAYPGEAEILVVDDASQDQSVSLLKERFPETRVILHEANRGFSEAVKTGMEHSSHEIAILLNTDVFPDRHFIAPLVRWFKRDDTFSVSPLIYNALGELSGVSWNVCRIEKGTVKMVRTGLEDIRKAHRKHKPLPSMFSSGGSMALRKSMFLELNGFLGIYKPFYHEDVDLCLRAWERGWKTYCEPESKVVHNHHSTINRHYDSLRINIIRKRNKFMYQWIHLSRKALMRSHIPWILPRIMGRIFRWDIGFVVGFFSALVYVKEIRAVRSSIYANRAPLWLDELCTMLQGILKDARDERIESPSP